jgi:hypothetical protein
VTLHQSIAIGVWALVALFLILCLFSAMAQLFGYRNVVELLIGLLILRVAPVLLIGYTIWAFLA